MCPDQVCTCHGISSYGMLIYWDPKVLLQLRQSLPYVLNLFSGWNQVLT